MHMFAYCVRVFTFAGWGKGSKGLDGWEGGLVVMLGPELPGSSLSSRNPSFGLIRQWREHVRLWHMVARVTCSFCLTLNFWPLEQNLPTPWLLHCSTCLPVLSSLHSVSPFILHVLSQLTSVWQVCVLHAASPYFHWFYSCTPHSRSFTLLHVIMTNDPLSESFIDRFPPFLQVCVFALCLSRQNAGWAPAIRSPSIQTPQVNSFHQPGKPDFQVSHPHSLDCCPLTCANMKEREREREKGGSRKGGWKEWNGKISGPLVTGWGPEKNTAQLSKPP